MTAVLDGDHGIGSIVGTKAMILCWEKAEKCGMAAVGIRNSNRYGTSAYYCEHMSRGDMIAFRCSNAEPCTTPPGALTVAIGNNPFCMVASCRKTGKSSLTWPPARSPGARSCITV